ncbi:MAG: hypothetical protein AB7G15_04075 [Alphaproteobacteria bacterium]
MRALLTAAALLIFGLAPASAETPSIKPFVGQFNGAAIMKNRDAVFFGTTARDLDTRIIETADGFRVTWITKQADDGTKRRTRESSFDFVPAGRLNIFKAVQSGDVAAGQPYAWARIDGRTLVVYVMEIVANGTPAMATYTRTIAGDEMSLTFMTTRDGEPVRVVSGKLKRKAP